MKVSESHLSPRLAKVCIATARMKLGLMGVTFSRGKGIEVSLTTVLGPTGAGVSPSRCKRWTEVTRWATLACLAYMMLLPVGNNAILLPVIGVFGVLSLVIALAERRRSSREFIVAIAGVVTAGVYGRAIGLGNPGVINGALVWIAAPLIFGAWVSAGDEKWLRAVFMVSAVATIVSSVWVIVYVGAELGKIPHLFPQPLLDFVGAGFDHGVRGSTAISYYGISTLVAAAPLWLTAAVLPHHPVLPPKALTVVVSALAAVATLLAGRGALTVLLLAVPAVLWVVWRILTRNRPRGRWRTLAPFGALGVTAAVLITLAGLGNTAFNKAWSRVITVLTGQGESLNDRIRALEATKLLQAWSQSPIFGHGFGATIPGYFRSGSRPWNFELQYHLILFQLGLLGAAVLLIAVGFAVYGCARAVRARPDCLPVLLVAGAGALSILVANATNPYPQAPGNMWPVYFLLMVMNGILVGNAPVFRRAAPGAHTSPSALQDAPEMPTLTSTPEKEFPPITTLEQAALVRMPPCMFVNPQSVTRRPTPL